MTWLQVGNMILSRISDTGKSDMGLHLVGETIDKNRSHYGAETGKLVQLMRGIYVDAGDDVAATVLRHAVRISRYLYPHTYIAAATVLLLMAAAARARAASVFQFRTMAAKNSTKRSAAQSPAPAISDGSLFAPVAEGTTY